jgi:hypothetical protein
MNKEFKKLLEASYTKGFEECARTGHKVGQLDAIFNSIVMGEFAELIVRECYEHCKGQVLDKEVADTNELTYNDAVGDCANGLLQHFGINTKT